MKGKSEEIERAICSNCGKEMLIVRVVGYDVEFNYWECERCDFDLDDYEPDKIWYSEHA